METQLIDRAILLLINGSGLWFGFWVLFADFKKKANQAFCLMTVLILLWIDFTYLSNFSKQINNVLLYVRIVFGLISLFFVSAYLFSIYFLSESKKTNKTEKIIFVVGVIFFIISVFTNFIIERVEFKEWGTDFSIGKLGPVFYLMVFILTILIIIHLFKKNFKLISRDKIKIQYLLMGASIFAFLNLIFNVFLPLQRGTHQFYQFGNYSAIFLIGFTAYAIVKQELFGIRVVLTQVLVGVIAIVLLAQAVTATDWLEFGWKFLIFSIFLYFGYLLIKSVILEIKRRQEIEKIDKAKSEFISIASHQLRTPLTAVKGYISMVLEGTYGQLAEKQAKPLENVYQSNERLIRLVNDLLNLSRLDAGKIEFSPELTSLEEMVSDIIEELRINAEKKGLYIKTIKPSKPLPEIMVDQDKLGQVILNIVDNAIKYTKRGGITFELKKLDKEEEIKISDTGEGMDEKELNSLFQMFSRATAGTQLHAEGAGLGLYVARQFIEMHGGKIWAESPGKNKGSTFFIRLPFHLDPKLLKIKTKTITKSANDIF